MSGEAMADFAALIEAAIEHDLRDSLISFLSTYQHMEFGRYRSLTLEEAALVIACTDRFLLTHNLLTLGAAEIPNLRKRLASIADCPTDASSEVVANVSFDALACITALEARLCRAIDRTDLMLMRRQEATKLAANDR